MNIDELIEERNRVQLKAEAISDDAGAKRWIELGIANRHIQRILNGEMTLTLGVEEDILRCIRRADI